MKRFSVISPEDFYGSSLIKRLRRAIPPKESSQSANVKRPKLPTFLTSLLGPSRTWKVFKKQIHAIEFCRLKRNGLMCFAYEQSDGNRLFLAAHPVYFWYIQSNRDPRNRCSYEIIQENAVCKLYLDIEFDLTCNKGHDGDRMLKTFLQIINHSFNKRFNVNCSELIVLDLDSTTVEKYSHHIIYQLGDVAFQDNYSAGLFVKDICNKLKEVKNNSESFCIEHGITTEDFEELFVLNKQGVVCLFCDECVYTKNRHFRTFSSTKRNKNSNLVLSANNKYRPKKCKYENLDLQYFLDSLITYFEGEVTRTIYIEDHSRPHHSACSSINNIKTDTLQREDSYDINIDKFITSLIEPTGRIRKKSMFTSSNLIIYEILGYRYCGNIQREHRSNNIKYIVDLNQFMYYQKCYDPNCRSYRSSFKPLPDQIKLLYEDEEVLKILDDFSKDLNEFELLKMCEEMDEHSLFEDDSVNFSDNGVSDEELLNVVELLEK